MKGNHKNGKKDGQWTEWSTTGEKKYENTHQQVLNHFGIYSGYSQQFLFKMERDLNRKKWL